MKRTRRINILRSIRSSLNRFLSIVAIVALGSGFLAGLYAASPDMFETADSYLDDYRLYDLDMKAPVGFTEDDAAAVAALPGVEALLAARCADMVLETADEPRITATARVMGTLGTDGFLSLNRFRLTDGRMPERADECVVQTTAGRYTEKALHIGDVLEISRENTDYGALCGKVTATKLTVVGICESPMSISVVAEPTAVGSGSITHMVYTPAALFTGDTYTDLFLTLEGAAALDAFGDAYKALVAEFADQYTPFATDRATARIDGLKAQVQDTVRRLRATVQSLESARQTERTLLAALPDQIAATRRTAEALAGSSQPGAAALARDLDRTADALQARLDASGGEVPESPALTEAQAGLETAQSTLNSLELARDTGWLFRTREDNTGFASYKGNVGKVAALCHIFPVFFFLVALLVALTTMTRLVEENRTQIGTLKAIGFSGGQILSEYILYSLAASVLGCAIGLTVGFRLFPAAISSAYGMMYFLPDTATPFRTDIAIWAAAVTVGSILLATLWATWAEFRACPAALMRPKAPGAGKRIWLEHIPFVWRRLPFSVKVTARNLFRYKKRFIMTVVGVAGCSALLLTGFGLRDSINDIVDKQYGEIYRYQLTVLTDSADAAESDDALRDFLADKTRIAAHLSFSSQNGKVLSGGTGGSVSICVPADPDAFPDFITLRERRSRKPIALDDSGVVLTEKLCEELGVRAGDRVTLENAAGQRADIPVSGITENYLTAYAYLTPEAYRTAFGQEPSFTTLLCRAADGIDADTLTQGALAGEHVLFARSSLSLKQTFADSIKSIDAVVFVLILSAGLLCMVVLYNLTNVNICERRKELATIRVLGFYPRETERYIFRETNTLSFLGALVGLGVGVWLHSFVIRTVEIDQVMFGRTVYLRSYLFALLISVGFTLLCNRLMAREIRRVDMVEAMKANE